MRLPVELSRNINPHIGEDGISPIPDFTEEEMAEMQLITSEERQTKLMQHMVEVNGSQHREGSRETKKKL